MAERPIFIPWTIEHRLVKEVSFDFQWNPGFAPVQKKKNITALHEAAAADGYSPLLEFSTKSEELLGQRLSAFSLKVTAQEFGEIPLECAFQGSKVFERGGPFTDLYTAEPRAAKKDPRIRTSGCLVEFRYNGVTFPLKPKTAFYDWLYITALSPHHKYLQCLEEYAGFTDIEFNPSKSVNCQARSCAMLAAMIKKDILQSSIQSPAAFITAVSPDSADQPHSSMDESNLFGC